jgi:hypothetical protein
MSAPLIEFECRPPVGGYDIVAFNQRRAKLTVRWDKRSGRDVMTLAPDATKDEQYLAQRWGGDLSIFAGEPNVRYLLRPRSERTVRFNLSQHGSKVFVKFAQAATYESLHAFTRGNNEKFFEGVKGFANRYGLLEDNELFGSDVNRWWLAMVEMRQALTAWDEAQKTGDCSKLIRILKKRDYDRDRGPPGMEAKVLLTKDSITASPRVCIRPSGLHNALFTQLAFAVDGQLKLRSCVECRDWFTIEAGRGRSDKKYCSNACQMRAYRKRKAKIGAG